MTLQNLPFFPVQIDDSIMNHGISAATKNSQRISAWVESNKGSIHSKVRLHALYFSSVKARNKVKV